MYRGVNDRQTVGQISWVKCDDRKAKKVMQGSDTDDDDELTAVVVRSVHAIDDFPEVVLYGATHVFTYLRLERSHHKLRFQTFGFWAVNVRYYVWVCSISILYPSRHDFGV